MALNLKNNGIFYLSRVYALNIDRFVAIANGVDNALLLTSFDGASIIAAMALNLKNKVCAAALLIPSPAL
ncbi:MAG: hypothetical protein LBC09_06355 [Helicobacteraceae bacterium]|jgi:hypothetical protein|nr:hypothetical protein [Helicobacteraceae bacterium]